MRLSGALLAAASGLIGSPWKTRGRVALAALFTLSAALTIFPELAAAAWKERTVVSSAHQVGQLTAAVSGDREVIGWAEGPDDIALFDSSSHAAGGRRGAYVAVRRRGNSRFGRAHRLTGASVRGLELAEAADGTILAAWLTGRRKLQVAWRLPARGWTDPATLASRAIMFPSSRVSVALAPEGTGLIAWLRGSDSNRAVEMAAVGDPGEVGPTQRLAEGPEVGPFVPAVDATDEGVGIVAWSGRCPIDGTPAYPAMAATTRDGAVLGPPEAIPESECPTAGLDAEIDGDGSALVLLDGKAFDRSRIRAAFKSQSSTTFGPAREISGGVSSSSGQLAGSAASSALAVWDASAGGHKRAVVAAWSSGGGIFGSPQTLGRLRGSPELAASSSGNAAAVWQTPSLRIAVLPVCADGAVGVQLTVSRKLLRQTLALPEVAVTGSRALVTWAKPAPKGRYRGIVAARGPISCAPS